MSKLNKYKLDTLYEISSGISTKPEQYGNGTPFLSFSTIFNNYFIPDELKELMNTTEKEQEVYSIKKGDIFLTRTSETLNELAMSCVALKDYPQATFSGFAKRLRPIQKNITYDKFMGFFLRSKYFRKIIDNNAIMTLRASFNEKIFSYLNVELPEYEEQVKIGNLLHFIEEKIKTNNKINIELEKLAKTLYDYWFVQFDFPDENKRPYKSSGGAMVYNDVLKKEIPIDWEVKNLFEAMDVQYGYPFNTDMFYEESDKDLIPVVRIRDILENTVSAYSSEKVDNKYKLNEKDLVIGMDGNFHMNFWKDNYSYLNQRSVRIRKKELYNISTFQAYYELMPYIKAREKNISRTTVGHLSDKDLKRLNIIIPKTNDNFNPTSVFENLLKKVIVNRKEIANLVTLRDFLLPMLMNGQISITDE